MKMWVQLGTAVAILAVFCILNNELIGHFAILDANRGVVATALIAGGLAACCLSLLSGRKRGATTPTESESVGHNSEEEKQEPFFLFTAHYLGALAIAFGTAFYWLPGLIQTGRPVVVQAAPAPPRKPVEPVLAPEPELTNHFPRIKIDGIFYRAKRPAALIDRRMFFIGDSIQGAQIIAIDRGSITLRMGTQTNRVGL